MTAPTASRPASHPATRAASARDAGGGRLLARYQHGVLGVAVIAMYTNLAIYSYVVNPGLLPKYVFFGLLAGFLPLLVARRDCLAAYMRSPFFLWAVLLLVLNLVHLLAFSTTRDLGAFALVDQQADARRAVVATRAQYVVFAIFFGFACYSSPGKQFIRVTVPLLVVVPCAILFDFLHPGLFYPGETDGAVPGRAAAMFINPTMAGEVVLHLALLACAFITKRYRTPLFMLAGLSVIATFSRSSMMAWVLILLILVVKRSLPTSALLATLAAVGLGLALSGSFTTYLQSREDFEGASNNILSRLNFFSHAKVDDDSAAERAEVARAAVQLFLQNPVFGAGAGATLFWSHQVSTHNQLFLQAAEYGIVGVALWIWMVIILWRGSFFRERGLHLAMVFLFMFMSMFTHLMFDSATYWLTTLALVAAQRRVPAGTKERQP